MEVALARIRTHRALWVKGLPAFQNQKDNDEGLPTRSVARIHWMDLGFPVGFPFKLQPKGGSQRVLVKNPGGDGCRFGCIVRPVWQSGL